MQFLVLLLSFLSIFTPLISAAPIPAIGSSVSVTQSNSLTRRDEVNPSKHVFDTSEPDSFTRKSVSTTHDKRGFLDFFTKTIPGVFKTVVNGIASVAKPIISGVASIVNQIPIIGAITAPITGMIGSLVGINMGTQASAQEQPQGDGKPTSYGKCVFPKAPAGSPNMLNDENKRTITQAYTQTTIFTQSQTRAGLCFNNAKYTDSDIAWLEDAYNRATIITLPNGDALQPTELESLRKQIMAAEPSKRQEMATQYKEFVIGISAKEVAALDAAVQGRRRRSLVDLD